MTAKYLARQKVLFSNVVGAGKIAVSGKPFLHSVKGRFLYDRRVYVFVLAVGECEMPVILAVHKPVVERTPLKGLAVKRKPLFV